MYPERIRWPRLLGIGLLLAIIALAWWTNQPETRLFTLDIQTGKIVWSSALPKSALIPQIATGNNKTIVSVLHQTENHSGKSQQLIAFDAISGQQLWEFISDEAFEASMKYIEDDVPLIFGNNLYFRFLDRDETLTLAALDLANGKLRWTQSAVAWFSEQAVIQQAGEHLVALFYENDVCTLSFLDPQTGERIKDIRRWIYENERLVPDAGPYLLADDNSIFLSTEQAVYAFDANTGAPRYKIQGYSRCIWLKGTTLYIGGIGQTRALDALTGDELWAYQDEFVENTYYATLRADSETVYRVRRFLSFSDPDAWLYALDAQSGNKRWIGQTTNYGTIANFQAVALSSAMDKVIVPGGEYDQTGITVLSAKDGTEHWHFRAHTGFPSPTSDGERVFAIRKSPRWRNWLSLLNPTW